METKLTGATVLKGANCTSAKGANCTSAKGAKLYSTKEAAKFLHLSLRTFKYLTSAKIIQPVQTGARQSKFYSEEHLLTYAKGAKSAKVQIDSAPLEIALVQKDKKVDSCKNAPFENVPSFKTKGNKMKNIQNIDNLPPEIRDSKRFFLVAENKRPLQKDWSNPATQKYYSEVGGLAGFDTVGHGEGVDYIFLDFDHVLDDEGQFVNSDAEDLFGELVCTFKNLFVEKSISGHGLHAFLKPTAGKFGSITNDKRGVLHFDDSPEKDAPKLELFYRSGGRYCLLTGNLFDCENGAIIPEGVEVDEYLTKLLDAIKKQQQDKSNKSDSIPNIFTDDETDNSKITNGGGVNPYDDDPPEYTKDLAIECFKFVGAKDLPNIEWFSCISCLKSYVSKEEARALCQNSAKYVEKDFEKQWNAAEEYGITTLIGKAERLGFSVKDFKRQWFKEHPEYQKARFNQAEKLRAADEKAFEDEKTTAIEYLKNLDTFGAKTVMETTTLKAAAFAKVFDVQTFSQFKSAVKNYGEEHPKEKVYYRDFEGALKDFVQEVERRQNDIERRGNVLKAEKDTAAFTASNDILSKFTIPAGYSISDDGIAQLRGKNYVQICYHPLIISEKFYSLDDKTFKIQLAFKLAKKWQYSPLVSPSVAFNQRKLPDLADYDLPVSGANSYDLVKFLDAFKAANEENLPVTCTVKQCGWRKINNRLEFIDPRRNVTITNESGITRPIKPAETPLTQGLKSKGSLDQWKSIYEKVKKYPAARFIVATAIASPLLKIFGERNFVCYIWGATTSGKTTALKFAASAVGNPEMLVKSFDGTNNGLLGTLADSSHYTFFIDEKQSADSKLAEDFARFIYSAGNGVGRQRAFKDGSPRPVQEWQNITLCNGETELLDDTATGGAYSRLLSVAIKSMVLPADLCREIYNTIEQNHGLILPLVIDQIYKEGFETLREMFNELTDELRVGKNKIQFEHCRYIALVTIADFLLNVALGVERNTAYDDAVETAMKIFPLIPTKESISDSSRARELFLGFVAENQRCFIGAVSNDIKDFPNKAYGRFDDDGKFITTSAVREFCKKHKLNYKAVVSKLIEGGVFIAQNGEYRTQRKIGKFNTMCFEIAPHFFKG